MITVNDPDKKVKLVFEISYEIGLFSDRTKHFYNRKLYLL